MFLLRKILKSLKKLAIGHSDNEHRFEYQKCLITASKTPEVLTKMTQVEKGRDGVINMWSLN